jgi:tRNA modification GTPase
MYATTITAEATAKGRAGISIVRLSGDKAFEICKLITKKNILDSPKLRILCGLYEKYDSDNSFDEALVVAFSKPNSFTGEDLIEFHCHGNPLIVSKLLNSLLNYGASLAKPGEFSQRAFMNGKLDLAQAEALMDIIHSRSEKLLSASTNQLKGGLGKAIDKVKQEILQALALIHGPMDFPLETEFQEVDLSTVKK